MNRAEFQRDQITRKSVFVRNKRAAPSPPDVRATTDEIDMPKISLKTMGIQQPPQAATSNKVAVENKINLCKTKYNMTERPHFPKPQHVPEKWDNLSQDNKLHIQERHDTPRFRPTTLSATSPDTDDTSMNMLLQLEKQINRIEFDTRVSEVPPPSSSPLTPDPLLTRKPIQYTGMESLLNTGVSNVATEGGIGYLEIQSTKNDTNENSFKRNTDVRQSIGIGTGDHRSKAPSAVKQCRPVQRTSSDTNQMKVIAMTKRHETTVTDGSGKKIGPLPPTRTAASLTKTSSGGKLKPKDDKNRPSDVRKFVEEHMRSRKVTIKRSRAHQLVSPDFVINRNRY